MTQELNREGLAKAIGVSNFYPDRLVDLIDHNEVTPAVNQIETHPFFQRRDYQELMRDRGVQIESWGPFADGKNNLFSDPTLSEIGAAHGNSVAQVVLRWLVQREVIVIPKSVRAERMGENIDVFEFELSDEEMTRIAGLDTGSTLFFEHHDPRWSAGSTVAEPTRTPMHTPSRANENVVALRALLLLRAKSERHSMRSIRGRSATRFMSPPCT